MAARAHCRCLVLCELLYFCVPVVFLSPLIPSRRRHGSGPMAAALSDEPGEMNRSERVQSPTHSDAQSTVADSQTIAIDLVPFRPKTSTRYDAQDKFVHQVNHFIIPLLFCDATTPYDGDAGPPPHGWEKYIHPEGALYYVHRDHQIVTCSDVYDQALLAAIHEARKIIHGRMADILPEDRIVPYIVEHRNDAVASTADWHRGLPEYELVLEVDNENSKEGRFQFKYYCADWQRCCIFWLEKDPWDELVPPKEQPESGFSSHSLGLDAPACYDQLHLTMQSEFWKNVEHFPSHRDLPPEWLPRLKSILKHATLDRMTSLASTVAAPLNELEQALNIFPKAGDDRDYINIFAGRQFCQIFFERSFNLYGTPHARMDRTQSRYFEPQPAKPQSVLGFALHIFSFVFIFGEAGSFHRKLCETWVDKTVFIDQWRSLLRDVQKEWKSTGFMATVILAVNMGFLAINQLGGDDSSKGGNDLPVLSQVFSVTSTLFSLGSIVSGMILRHQHRALDTDLCTAKEANAYMIAYANRGIGLYSAAVLFSMPFGMLLWSLVLFIAGVLSFSFVRFSHFVSPFIAATTGIALLVVGTQIWYFHGLEPKRKGSTWKQPPKDPNDDGEGAAAPPPRGRRLRVDRAWTFARKMSRSFSFWSTSTVVESGNSSPDLERGLGSPKGRDSKEGMLRKLTARSFTTRTSRDRSDPPPQAETSPPNPDVPVPPLLRQPSERRPVFPRVWLSRIGANQQQPEMMMMESPTSITPQTPLHSPFLPT